MTGPVHHTVRYVYDIRCGTCEYFRPQPNMTVEATGDCRAPIPASVLDNSESEMTADDGKGCDAWEPTEQQRAKHFFDRVRRA